VEPTDGIVESARRLADDVLFPGALEVDASELVPLERLDALAGAGLYGLAGPREAGGLGADLGTFSGVMEALAGGCLTTAFVWAQHHGAVRTLAAAAPSALRSEWLGPLCNGERRAGAAFAGLRRPGPPVLTARPADGGYELEGSAPWVTGWGRIDVVHVAARTDDGRVVWSLLDATASPTLAVEPLRLAALDASGTVTLRFSGQRVPEARVTLVEEVQAWRTRDAAGLRPNASHALGVAGRALALIGGSSLDAELAACRSSLDAAAPAGLPAARAWASELAVRAASLLVVAGGGRSVLRSSHAQRLAREAMFLLVFGQTAEIRTEQLTRLAPPAA